MKRAMVMPRKYIQGDGVLAELAQYVALLGKKPIVLWGTNAKRETSGIVALSFKASGMAWAEMHFPGESTKELANALAAAAAKQRADVIVGIGGGKAVDTAKGAACFAGLPVIIVPTVTATDAPVTSTAGWYENGIMTEIHVSPFNPDILIVDTGVISRSPRRLFVSGMGDGLTTWIEADAAWRARSSCSNRGGGLSTLATRAMARLCYDTLLTYGMEALRCLEQKAVTPVFEDVVEALVLLSGVGGESGGIAAAHSVANNLPWFEECGRLYHGELVAFGVMVQLVLENALPPAEIYRAADFMADAGLPVTLADICLADASPEKLYEFALYCIESSVSFFGAMPEPVTQKSLYDAIRAADALGRERKKTNCRSY